MLRYIATHLAFMSSVKVQSSQCEHVTRFAKADRIATLATLLFNIVATFKYCPDIYTYIIL